jgi:hypothetical protein
MTYRVARSMSLSLAILAAGCGEKTYLFGALAPDGGIPDATVGGDAAVSDGAANGAIQDSGLVLADASQPIADGPQAAASCSFRSSPPPSRMVLLSNAEANRRLNNFLAPSGSGAPLFQSARLATTAEVETAVRAYFGSTDPAHLRTHSYGTVASFFPGFMDALLDLTHPLNAFVSGAGGLGVLLNGALPASSASVPRKGIFSDSNVLTRYKQATARGAAIQNVLLCSQIPSPPDPDVPLTPPTRLPGQTYRQALAQATSQNECHGCHQVLDPAGFAFEHYDQMGQYRATDNGLPIDTAGNITLDGKTVSFRDEMELMIRISESCAVRECLSRKWLTHALKLNNRTLTTADESSVREVASAFMASGDNLLELVIAITKTPAFLAP